MKKIMLYAIFVLVLVVLSACGNDDSNKKENTASDQAGEKSADQEEQGVEVDKGLLNVEVVLPKEFIGEEDVDQLIADAKEEGVKEVTKNDDGSLTYKMSKSVYNGMMKDMTQSTLDYIEEMKNNEDFTSIKDVISNKSFSEFTIVADQEGFENSFDGFAALGLGMSGLFYQVFDGVTGDDAKVTIAVENAETGEVFDTMVYPDDFDTEEQ